MEQKYLPIGSVCTLKGKNKKVMITGYYSVEFNGNFKINDYCGYVYPEGELLPEQKCNFNHTDIEKIDFVGYKNEEEYRFKKMLNRLVGNEIDEVEEAKEFHEQNEMVLTSNSTYSKLLFDENGVVMIADPVEKEEKKSSSNIKFDKDGYVISVDDDDDIDNPFKTYYEERIQEEKEPSEWKIFDKYEFSEDGTVLEVNENKQSSLSKIEFDENGVVVAVNSESLKNNKYTFDENGTLIGVSE